MTDRPPFELPGEMLIDARTGLALNVPIIDQVYPFWWEDHPAEYALLQSARQEAGIHVVDFPDGPVRREDDDTVYEDPADTLERLKREAGL